jgi:hypothetical protein
LSSLVREVGALTDARRRARAIREVAERQAEDVGLTTCHLGIGEACWIPEDGGEPLQAPVLVRPVTLRLSGRAREDVELDLDATVDVNPALLRALRDAGIAIDARALLSTTEGPYGFDPTPVLDSLKALGRPLDGFRVSNALVVGNLMDAAGPLAQDLMTDHPQWVDDPLVAALSGDPEARGELGARTDGADAGTEADPDDIGLPEIDESRMVSALDPDQTEVLRRVLAGQDLAVSTPPGISSVPLVVDLAAELCAHGKSVLVLSQRRENLAAIAQIARRRGLEDLVFDLSPDPTLQRNASNALLQSLRRAGSFSSPVSTEEPPELAEAREVLSGHVEAMHRVQQPWNASAHEALSALAALTRRRHPPRTEVRLSRDIAANLVGEDRARQAEALEDAAQVGLLGTGPEDTAWFGAPISTDTQATEALRLVENLRDELLPRMRRAVRTTGPELGLAPARSFASLTKRVQMLDQVRATLNVFQPAIFSSDLEDLIAATGDSAWRQEHGVTFGWLTRRRLRRQALDLQRPAAFAPDLHGALEKVRSVRESWRKAADGSRSTPSAGDGDALDRLHALLGDLQTDLDALAVLLEGTPAGGDLARTEVDTLASRIDDLYEDRADLEAVPARTRVQRSLEVEGLGDLLADLRERKVAGKDVSAELDLAWWRSVLEHIARAEPTISQYDGTALSQVADRFRRLDAENLERASYRVRAACDDVLVTTMKSFPDTSRAAIRELARSSTVSVRDLAAKYEDILFRARPVWLASPYLVPQVVPRGKHFDVVIVADGGRLPTAAALPGVIRAEHTVVIGDTLDYAELPGSSVLDDMLEVAVHVPLHREERPSGSLVRAFAQRRSLAQDIQCAPCTVLPEPDRLAVVADGRGPVTESTDAVESTEGELRKVTDLVIEHARTRPERSLAVLTLTEAHAGKVMERIMQTVSMVPGLREFFDTSRTEEFLVLPASRASSVRRDDVIVSIGFGKTPHGRLLHRFGPLSGPGGRKALGSVLTRARGRTTVVTAFDIEDIVRDRLRSEGAQDLYALLTVLHGGEDPIIAEAAEATDAAKAAESAGVGEAGDSAGETKSVAAADGAEDDVDAAIEAALAAAGSAGSADDADETADDVEDTAADASDEVADVEGSADADTSGADAAAEVPAADAPDPDAEAAEAEDAVESDPASEPDESGAEQIEPAEPPHAPIPSETNALVSDLADRLWRHGLQVETDFGQSADRVDLALGHPDLPGRYLVAVETDGDRYVATTSQRERDRLHAERLESAGWATERVWSWALFSDPEGEAERIHRAVDHARAQFLDVDPARSPEGVGTIRHRLPRPQIPAGHPLSFYASEDFDAVVEYICSDGRGRLEEQLAGEVRAFLGFTQRAVLLDVAVSGAIRRYQERQ